MLFMRCDICTKEIDSYFEHWRGGKCSRPSLELKKKGSYDPERIIHEYGAKKLSETREGQIVLNKARKKYAAELVQPGDPEFNKLYGKQVKEREEARRELQEKSRSAWEAQGGRETKILHEG